MSKELAELYDCFQNSESYCKWSILCFIEPTPQPYLLKYYYLGGYANLEKDYFKDKGTWEFIG